MFKKRLLKKLVNRCFSRESIIPVWLIVLLVLLCLVNVTRIFQAPLDENRPIDFRPLYIGQYLLLNGGDPYDFDQHVEAWKEISAREGYEPAGRMLALVYPPWALPIFMVFAPISFSAAYIIWYSFLPLFILVFTYCCLRCFLDSWSWIAYGEAILLIFAFKGTIQSMTVGQPVFLSLAFGFASLMFYKKKREVLAGVLLAFAAFKISLGLPFIAFFVLKGRTRVVFSAMTTGFSLYSLSAIMAGNFWGPLTGWINSIQMYFNISFDQNLRDYPTTYGMVTKTEIGTLLEYFFHGTSRYFSLIYLGLIVLLVAWWLIGFRPKRSTNLFLFLLLTLLGLLFSHHFYYDCLLLLPLYAFVRRLSNKNRGLLFALTAAFWIPVNGILNRLDPPPPWDIFYFTTPLTLVALTVFLFWRALSGDSDLVRTPVGTNLTGQVKKEL